MAYEDYYEEDCGEFAEEEAGYDDEFDDGDDDIPVPDGDNDDGGYDDEDNY